MVGELRTRRTTKSTISNHWDCKKNLIWFTALSIWRWSSPFCHLFCPSQWMSISVHLNIAHTTQNNLSKRSWVRSLSSQERHNDKDMVPLVRIGKGDRSLSVLSLSFKFQFKFGCFSLVAHVLFQVTQFKQEYHFRFYTISSSWLYSFWKQINLQKAVKHNKRKKLISSINRF